MFLGAVPKLLKRLQCVVIVALLLYFAALIILDHVCLVASVLVTYALTSLGSKWSQQALNPKGKTILITGCDSGFGLEMANSFSKDGLNVIATVLDPKGPAAEALRAAGAHVVKMDVRNVDDIERCFETTKKIVADNGLWALVNNAGLATFSEVELCSTSQAEEMIDVNLTGVVRVVNRMLTLVRMAKGRLVFISSVLGDVPMPFLSIYSASKFGVTGFAGGLREEMKKWNVSVTVIKPSLSKTGCDSGFGFAMAKTFSRLGLEVIATVLSEEGSAAEKLRSSKVHVIQVDVTKIADVERCLEETKKIVGKQGLWALVNNAGVGLFGEVELCTTNLAEKLIDTNLTGVIRMTQKMLRLVRMAKGRLVFMSSLAGDIPLPLMTIYSASKAGTTTFANAIREEVAKWGVKVTVIKPIMAKTANTNFVKTHASLVESDLELIDAGIREDYGPDYMQTYKKLILDKIPNQTPKFMGFSLVLTDTERVVEAAKRAVLDANPPRHIKVGFGTSVLSMLNSLNADFTNMLLTTMLGYGEVIWFSRRKLGS